MRNKVENIRKINAEREYPYCKFCNKILIMGKTVSAYKRIREDTCNKCNKLRLKSKGLHSPRKLNKTKLRKIKDSIPQRILFRELQNRIFHSLRYNYPVRTLVIQNEKRFWNIRYIDVADLDSNIAYEYDGEKFHKPKTDKKRDEELNRAGWQVIHITKKNIQRILDDIEKTKCL